MQAPYICKCDLRTNPSRDKPIEDCNALDRGLRQRFATRGLQQSRVKRFLTIGVVVEDRNKQGVLGHSAIYIDVYIHTCTYTAPTHQRRVQVISPCFAEALCWTALGQRATTPAVQKASTSSRQGMYLYKEPYGLY